MRAKDSDELLTELHPLQNLVTGRCELVLPFRSVELTITGGMAMKLQAITRGLDDGDIVTGLNRWLSLDVEAIQMVHWKPFQIQPTPEHDQDRWFREHGGRLFQDGWLAALTTLAPRDGAMYSVACLGAWLRSAREMIETSIDEPILGMVLGDLAAELEGESKVPRRLLAGTPQEAEAVGVQGAPGDPEPEPEAEQEPGESTGTSRQVDDLPGAEPDPERPQSEQEGPGTEPGHSERQPAVPPEGRSAQARSRKRAPGEQG